MRLLHSPARTHATFDDPNLVSHSGLVPVMALAQRAGLADLVAGHVRPGGECGVNAHLKVGCLVAGMTAGADSIEDMDLLALIDIEFVGHPPWVLVVGKSTAKMTVVAERFGLRLPAAT